MTSDIFFCLTWIDGAFKVLRARTCDIVAANVPCYLFIFML